MSEPAWVTAALQGLNTRNPKEDAAVMEAIIKLAGRFTTSKADEENRQFIESMRAVHGANRLTQVIAGLITLLDHMPGGMTAMAATAKLTEYLQEVPSAPPAPRPPAATGGGAPQNAADAAATALSGDELKSEWEGTSMDLYSEALETLKTYVANKNATIDYNTYDVEQALTKSATLLEDRTMPTERQTILREAAAQAKFKYELARRELQDLSRGKLTKAKAAALHPGPPSVLKF